MITLSQLCRKARVTRRVIQGYEKEKLISAVSKNERGYLLYEENAVERVKQIRFFQGLGFKVKEIRNLETVSKEQKIEIFRKKEKEMICLQKRQEEYLKELRSMIQKLEEET